MLVHNAATIIKPLVPYPHSTPFVHDATCWHHSPIVGIPSSSPQILPYSPVTSLISFPPLLARELMHYNHRNHNYINTDFCLTCVRILLFRCIKYLIHLRNFKCISVTIMYTNIEHNETACVIKFLKRRLSRYIGYMWCNYGPPYDCFTGIYWKPMFNDSQSIQKTCEIPKVWAIRVRG